MAERGAMSQPDGVSIRATCPSCGDVDLVINQIRAQLCVTDNKGSYSFNCPSCTSDVSKPAEAGVVDLLVSAGVELTVWERPSDADEMRDDPAFTWDDVLAFHDALQQDDWLDKLLDSESSAPPR